MCVYCDDLFLYQKMLVMFFFSLSFYVCMSVTSDTGSKMYHTFGILERV